MGEDEQDARFSFTVQARIAGHAGQLNVAAWTIDQVRAGLREAAQRPDVEIMFSLDAPVVDSSGTPWCPRHGVPMRDRQKQGDTWYSHNVGSEQEPVWCKGHEGKDSPGWDVRSGRYKPKQQEQRLQPASTNGRR